MVACGGGARCYVASARAMAVEAAALAHAPGRQAGA